MLPDHDTSDLTAEQLAYLDQQQRRLDEEAQAARPVMSVDAIAAAFGRPLTAAERAAVERTYGRHASGLSARPDPDGTIAATPKSHRRSESAALANPDENPIFDAMEQAADNYQQLEDLSASGNDPQTSELGRETFTLALATGRIIQALMPPTGDPLRDAHNPYADDTPAAAEARLKAAHQAEQAAHAVGRMLAMREIEAGHVSQRRAAEIFQVAPMTMNRAYRDYQAEKAGQAE